MLHPRSAIPVTVGRRRTWKAGTRWNSARILVWAMLVQLLRLVAVVVVSIAGIVVPGATG